MAALTAVRNRQRGKAHRPMHSVAGRSATYETCWTVCGFTCRQSEFIPVQQTAPEGRCRICWPLPAAPTEEPTPRA